MNELYSDNIGDDGIELIKNLEGPILIVGASGFIGVNLLNSIARHRNDVYGASPGIFRNWRLVKSPFLLPHQLLALDITNFFCVERVINEIKPRTIFNLSAYGAYQNQGEPKKIHEVNYFGTLNLLESLRSVGFSSYVQAGSLSEYGYNCNRPTENAVLWPNSHYAASKGASQLLVSFYGRTLNLPVCHLRLYSIYGPWEDPQRLIPSLVRAVRKKDLPPFADPSLSRDFVYVDDCILAFIRAAIYGCKQWPGEVFNIGSGTKTTLRELAEKAKEVFQIDKEPVFGAYPNRIWDVKNWGCDPSLAKEKLKWTSRTELIEGLKLTFAWEEKFRASPQYQRRTEIKKVDKISAIIACYQDAKSIPELYARLVKVSEKLRIDIEMIFVNDSSPTDDWEVISNLALKDFRVVGISHSRNFGSQSAFLSGIEVSTGDAIVLMDGDLQDPPELIESFYSKWKEGADVVYGVRIKRVAPLYMQMFYKTFYRLFKAMANISIPLDAGDFSLIDRKVVLHLLSFTEKDIFLRGLRAWVGFQQIGVPYVRPERKYGRTTNSFLKNIWWAKKALFSFSTTPLNIIQCFGIVLFALSFLLGLFYFGYYFLKPSERVPGITTIILLVLGMGGLNIFVVSILGDYIGKILEEVKNRPHFIRSRIIREGKVEEPLKAD